MRDLFTSGTWTNWSHDRREAPAEGTSGRALRGLWLAACLTLCASPSEAEEELLLGHTAVGQLKVQVGFEQPFGLPVSVFPGLPGYATGEMGFHSAPFDQPDDDFFLLSTAADFRFILLAKDPGMEVLNDHGSAYMTNGESFFIGSAPFDTHPVWDLVSASPGNSYSLSLKVRDLKGIYTDSEPVVLAFAAVPPVLTISSASPGFVTLSWAPAAPGLVLQASPTLLPAAWSNAPSGATNPVTLPVSLSPQFYRLRK